MEINEPVFNKIEKYLKGKLSEGEARSFEKEISDNPELAELVELQSIEQEASEYLIAKDLKEKINSWEQNPATTKVTPNKKENFNWKLIALLALILMGILFFFLIGQKEETSNLPIENQQQKERIEKPSEEKSIPDGEQKSFTPNIPIAKSNPSEEKTITPSTKESQANNAYGLLADNTYESSPSPLKDLLIRGTASDDPNDVLNKGIQALANNQYQEALVEFKKVMATNDTDAALQASEFIAHTYFRMKNYEQAASTFEEIVKEATAEKSNTLLDRAEWFLVLSRLKNYETNKSQIDTLLEKISNRDNYHNYQVQAEILKKKIELTK